MQNSVCVAFAIISCGVICRLCGRMPLLGTLCSPCSAGDLFNWLSLEDLRARNMAENVAIEVHRAALPGCVREKLRRTLGKPDVGIRDDEPNALQAACLQMLEEAQPAGLIFLGALDDAEDLAIALAVHGDRNQERDVPEYASGEGRLAGSVAIAPTLSRWSQQEIGRHYVWTRCVAA